MRIVDKIRSYLLDALKDEELGRFENLDSIKAIKNTALKEKYYGAEIFYRYSKYNAIRDWLQGLGLSGIAFSYYDIANLMREWGYTVNENDDLDYFNKQDLYWDLLTQIIDMA